MIAEVLSAQSGRYAHSSPSEATKTPSNPLSRAWISQPGLSPLLHGTGIVCTLAGYSRCRLPARSIPGSEMLMVEKTRILGMFSTAPESPDIRGLLRLAEEQVDRPGLVEGAKEIVAHLLAPGRDVLQRSGIRRHDFHHVSDGHATDLLLGSEDRAGERDPTRVHHDRRRNGLQFFHR